MLDALHVSSDLRRLSASAVTGVVLLVAAAVIIAALGFEHIAGYAPCPLCLQQRYAYYAGIPALMAALGLLYLSRPKVAAAVLAAVGLAFLVNAGLAPTRPGLNGSSGTRPPPVRRPRSCPASTSTA
jgi:disulfide bond formation protein DsbB